MTTKKDIRYIKLIDREIDKAVSKFSQHFMSNSKWVRLINNLVENINKVKKIEIKKIQKEEVGQLYLEEDTTLGFDYWQDGFEGHNSFGGWLMFREIEYLFFPKIVDSEKLVEQDTKQIEALLQSIGQFALESSSTGLKLTCYKR